MRLSRREVLTALLGAPLAGALAACDEPAPPGVAGTNLDPDLTFGHRLRGAAPSDTDFANARRARATVVVIGGGPSGLSAARQLKRRNVSDVWVVELEPRVGGTSLHGEGPVTAFPWGAHYITRPLPNNRPLLQLLREMDIFETAPAGSEPAGVREQFLVTEPKERLFYRGFFYEGLYPSVGATEADRREWQRFQQRMLGFARLRDGAGQPAFAIPVRFSSKDASLLALDRISAAEWLRREGFSGWRVRFMVDYACRDDYGLSAEHTSAWALILYYAARIDPLTGHGTEVITWPEGNGALVRHLRDRASARVEAGKLVVDVKPTEGGAEVLALDAHGKAMVIEAKRVIMATPQFITRRIVRPLRDGDDRGRRPMRYGAWMVANLHLRSRPAHHGCESAWDSVLFDSPSLGYVSATHQRGRSHGRGVWTYYLPMADADAAAGRRRLYEATHDDLVDAVMRDLRRAHHDLSTHVTRVDTRRWGHGMVQPRVGHLFSGARALAAKPVGPIHFAHSDLSGVALFEEAFDQGYQAANAVADALQS